MNDVLHRVHKIVGDITQDAFLDGRKQERERVLKMLEDEIERFEKHPYKLGSFDTHGIYLGLKMAHLHVKEQKWT
jgi:hypothetical protein